MNRILLSLLFLLLTSCQREENSHEERIKVVCSTTGMITDLAKQIGGSYIEVRGLMGPGIDPHLYRATEGDVLIMERAHMILHNGLHLEGKMGDLFTKMATKKKVVAISEDIPHEKLIVVHEEWGKQYDPHIWFDVSLWKHAVHTVERHLSELDPRYAAHYRENALLYLEQLDQLDGYIRDRTEELQPEQRILVTAHDAFSYFGRAYGFQVIALQGVNTEAESGIREIQLLAEFIVQHRIPAIFVETSISEKSLRAVQEAVSKKNWKVSIGGELFSDSMGNLNTPEERYIEMCRHNIDTIISSLSDSRDFKDTHD